MSGIWNDRHLRDVMVLKKLVHRLGPMDDFVFTGDFQNYSLFDIGKRIDY
jgi:hypothetical protein